MVGEVVRLHRLQRVRHQGMLPPRGDRIEEAPPLIEALARAAGDDRSPTDEQVAEATAAASRIRDELLATALVDLDGSSWRYLAALEAAGGSASRDELSQRLGDTTRFSRARSQIGLTADDLIRRRILCGWNDTLSFSHPRYHEMVLERR